MPKRAAIFKHLQLVAEIFPAPMYWLDTSSVVLGVSTTGLQNVGALTREIFVGKTAFDLYPKKMAIHIIQHNNEVMQFGKISSQEEAITDITTGEIKYFMAVKAPLRDEAGNIIGLIGTSVDITDRKKMESDLLQAKEAAEVAEAADKAKTAFLENIRHDLRTPLTGIIGSSDLIKSEANKVHHKKIADYAENVQASSQALLELMNEVLEAMRIASGERPLLKKKFNLKVKAEQVINLNLAKACEKNLSLALNYDDAIPKFLIGDPQRIQRILLELITNALNFTQHGKVEVTVKLAKINEDTRDIVVQMMVSDTGIGIPIDRQEEIFERFNRLTPSYEGTHKGLGLGLAIVKQFIDDLNAEIFLDGSSQGGTVFVCTIPLKQALLENSADVDQLPLVVPAKLKLAASQPVTMTSVAPVGSVTALRVLLVEDNALAAKVTQALLTEFGCAVDIAIDGIAAVNHATTNSYDFIFMDVGLPKLDGNEAARQIRRWETLRDRHVAIIGLTAHIDAENKQCCIAAGMDAVLSKPLTRGLAHDILNAFTPKLAEQQLGRNQATAQKAWFALPEKIIDPTLGAEITGNHDSAMSMLKMLVEEVLPEALEEIKRMHLQQDWRVIQQSIHKLHGGVSYCGTPRLKAACLHLENYLARGQTEDREKLYQQFLTEVDGLSKTYAKRSD